MNERARIFEGTPIILMLELCCGTMLCMLLDFSVNKKLTVLSIWLQLVVIVICFVTMGAIYSHYKCMRGEKI